MALPDPSTGSSSSRTLPFEPGANGITVFPLRSIATTTPTSSHNHVDDRQSAIFANNELWTGTGADGAIFTGSPRVSRVHARRPCHLNSRFHHGWERRAGRAMGQRSKERNLHARHRGPDRCHLRFPFRSYCRNGIGNFLWFQRQPAARTRTEVSGTNRNPLQPLQSVTSKRALIPCSTRRRRGETLDDVPRQPYHKR